LDKVLLVVRYASDVERKRLEYLLSRYSGRLKPERLHGAVLFLEGRRDVIESFLRELYVRVPRERVDAYYVEKFDIEVEPRRVEGRIVTSLNPEAAWGAIELLARKLKGVLVSMSGGEKRYRLYIKGVVVDVTFRVSRSGSSTVIDFTVEGYDDHVEAVYSELERELSYLAG
jgi:hypothetical protein